MRIQHNIMAMNAYRNYNNNTSALSKNLEKLSSGYKINRAGDDAAGLAISEKMRAQITGLNAASKNVKDGISLVKTAEGAMQEIQDMLNRMDYLATQSANGTYDNEVDRANLQKEVDALKTEINRIADSANFNGIKLLDGSLADKQVATKIEIGGNFASVKSEGAKGKYSCDAGAVAAETAAKAGDTFTFTASLEDGTSKSVTLTLGYDDVNKKNYLEAADGTKYDVAVTTNSNTNGIAITQNELTNCFVKELEKSDLGKDFVISQTSGKIAMEAKEKGTDTPKVTAFDYEKNLSGTRSKVDMGVKVDTPATDDGREIKATDITEYDGTNLEDALFTINGKKFVLLTETMDGTTTGTANTEYLRTALGLGSDVTILVGGTAGLTSGNGNFNQNCKAIEDATGLTVTDAINESTIGAAADTGVAPGAGIRLSKGKGTTGGGLTLQIGDTADDFNQMKVAIGDMHTKAMGIADVDISTQDGAAAAIQTIKNAINYVSGVRGDLGAVQNRLEHTQNNLSVMAENIQDAESTIRDTDVAEEMMSYVKNNILVQSAQAMLAQANQVPQGVLQLLG
ncbi:MAG: flagellin [Oscillospiraceae bacterium]|nr:flagellin [Oscillospiraceae bacterium]